MTNTSNQLMGLVSTDTNTIIMLTVVSCYLLGVWLIDGLMWRYMFREVERLLRMDDRPTAKIDRATQKPLEHRVPHIGPMQKSIYSIQDEREARSRKQDEEAFQAMLDGKVAAAFPAEAWSDNERPGDLGLGQPQTVNGNYKPLVR